jgi:NYN domain
MVGENTSKLAVLIDAENTVSGIAESLLASISTFGITHVRRAYGDWMRPGLKAWKEHCLAHSIEPIQQLSYVRGKNLADMAMVIDAMDLLHTGHAQAVRRGVQHLHLPGEHKQAQGSQGQSRQNDADQGGTG